jgi:hypothetical protein
VAPLVVVLGESLRGVLEESKEAAEDLTPVAEMIARYWAAEKAGDPRAARNLEFAEALAATIAVRHAIKSERAAKRRAVELVKLTAKIGLAVVMAAV